MNLTYNDPNAPVVEEGYNLSYLSRKWGISSKTIHEAVLSTGTLQPELLRQYLKQKALMPPLLVRMWQNLKERLFVD